MALIATQVSSAKKPGRYGDGQGLYLVVTQSKGEGERALRKQWVLRIVIGGKRRDLGLGGYPTVSLSRARRKAEEYRVAVAGGLDPTRKVQEPEPPPIPTFAEAARECHKANAPRWKNQRHTDAWLQTLERHAFPILGDMPVDQIERGHVLSVLEPIWGVRQETARRVRQRIRSIMRWCMAHDLVQVNVAGEAIDGALPPMPRLKARMKALDYRDVPDALGTVANSLASLSAKLCFRFQVLTAARSGEARGATWTEIDFEREIWIIPGARMKMGIDHRVPLSEAAMSVLVQARLLMDETDLVFPSVNGKMLSDSTLSKLLRENDVGAVPHGFRSSFRDWAAENTQATWAAMELSLAHAVGPDVERAYSRSDLLQQRRELMEAWGVFLYGASRASTPVI